MCGLSASGSSLLCAILVDLLETCFSLLLVVFFFRPRVTLWDREPGPNARKLGTAGALRIAPPSPALKGLASLVSQFMPAMVVHDVSVPTESINEDYPAMELLYCTDAYEYLLHIHFTSKGVYHPKTMRLVCQDSNGAERNLVVLWNARFMSAA